MALAGFKPPLQVLMGNEVVQSTYHNAFPAQLAGKALQNETSVTLRSDFKGYGASLARVAAPHLSCRFQPAGAVSPKIEAAAVGGPLELTLNLKHMVGEREEAKAMAVDFLRARGVSGPLAARAVNKATRLIAHLLSLLLAGYRTRYLSGRELTTLEIQSTVLPFLESLGAQHKEGLVDVFISFPDPPPAKTEIAGFRALGETFMSPVFGEVNLRDYPQLQSHMVDGKLRPSLMYFLKLGFPPEQVEGLVARFPTITSYSVEGKIKPVVDLLLGMGLSITDIPKIVLKRPQLFGCSLEDNIKPTVAFLEGLGVEPERWARILSSFPHILTYSYGKFEQVVKFLTEIGLSPRESGRVLTRFPHIVGYSVEVKLKPIVNYFYSIGVLDLRNLVLRSPQTLGLSLELNIKPTLLFFSDIGYTREELSTIIIRFPQILGLNVEGNVQPKWDYFLKMERLHSELVDFPQYFGYSLEKRIKPRYEALVSHGVFWTLNRMLSSTDVSFQKNLEKDSRLVTLVRSLHVTEADGD